MSSIEERVEQPLKWDPKDVEVQSMEAIRKLIGIAVENGMVGARTGDNILKILEINPHARLSRLGQRIEIVTKTATEIVNIQDRLLDTMRHLRIEIEYLQRILNKQPEWRQEDEIS